MKKYFALLSLVFISISGYAQIDSAEVYRQLFGDDEEIVEEKEVEKPKDQLLNNYDADDEDDEEEAKGIPIFVSLQPAVYFANGSTANYYNGSVEEFSDVSQQYVIQRIWDSPNNKRIIKDDFNPSLTDAEYDAVNFDQSNFNYNMTYDIGYLIGFQAFFAIKPRFAILLGFNFVSLNTASEITFYRDETNGTPNQLTEKMNVFGKEQRFIIDLAMHWILGKQRLKYYVEGGPNFLMAKATDNYFETGLDENNQNRWNLNRSTGNNTAANTITSFTFGAYAGAGLFFKMNDNFAFEFGPQLAYNNIKFPGYSGYFSNFQLNLRIIYLAKSSEM